MSRTLLPASVLCAAALAPAAAQAHLVASGMGPVYDGVAHFALSPEDGLPVLALAAFAGLRGPRAARLGLGALGLSWLAGGLAVTTFGLHLPAAWLAGASAGMLLLFGGLLAANPAAPPWTCVGGAVGLGLVRGAADFSGLPPTSAIALDALGAALTASVLFALAASVALPLQRPWTIVATRVAGSWIAAVGLLLAGWIARYGAGVA